MTHSTRASSCAKALGALNSSPATQLLNKKQLPNRAMEEEFTEVLEAFREFRSVITCDDWDRYCEVRELDTLLNLLMDLSERQQS